MPKPTQKELKAQKAKIKSLTASIGEGGTLTERQMCTIVRSAIRKAWMRSPVKLLKLELAKVPDNREKTRTKWLMPCEHCDTLYPLKNIQVDHIKGEHKLTGLDDISGYANSVLNVSLDDLQILCKPCHEVKTLAERQGLTLEEAKIEKSVINYFKVNKVDKQKGDLLDFGYEGKEVSNLTKRKDLIRKLFKEGQM